MDNKILETEYLNYIKPIILSMNPDILLYGSTIYGIETSDLDVAFITLDFNKQEFERLKNATIQFQNDFGMTLDEEVPYSNKLIYKQSEVEDMLKKSPFKRVNGIYQITPVEINEEYFSSKEMKYRLLLNILTTRSVLIQGNKERIDNYRKKAWELLIKIVISYNRIYETEIDQFLELLYQDKKNQVKGEDFLGYKRTHDETMIYLKEDCEEALYQLAQQDKVKILSKSRFKVNEKWVKEQ